MSPCKNSLITVARLVYRGDVGAARTLRETLRRSVSVSEARAIHGAIRSLRTRFGAVVPDAQALVYGAGVEVTPLAHRYHLAAFGNGLRVCRFTPSIDAQCAAADALRSSVMRNVNAIARSMLLSRKVSALFRKAYR